MSWLFIALASLLVLSCSDQPPDPPVWTVARGEYEGRPMFVRLDTSARGSAIRRELPTRLGIAIPLKNPDERGLPRTEEFAELDAIEDNLVAALRVHGEGRMVLVLTTGGMREFVSYVRTPEAGVAAADQVRTATSTHQVQHYTQQDPEWSAVEPYVTDR